MELGEHNITANALIPGLIDTALTRDEKRLSESNCEQGQEVEHPTPQQASDNRAPTVPLKVGRLVKTDDCRAAAFVVSGAAIMATGARYEVTSGSSAKDIQTHPKVAAMSANDTWMGQLTSVGADTSLSRSNITACGTPCLQTCTLFANSSNDAKFLSSAEPISGTRSLLCRLRA